MATVQISWAANRDTREIVLYLAAEAGKRTAIKYVSLLEALYARLSEFPDIGAPRPTLGQDIRISVISPFVVIYEHTAQNDLVTILRVIHGNRRITSKLLSR